MFDEISTRPHREALWFDHLGVVRVRRIVIAHVNEVVRVLDMAVILLISLLVAFAECILPLSKLDTPSPRSISSHTAQFHLYRYVTSLKFSLKRLDVLLDHHMTLLGSKAGRVVS